MERKRHARDSFWFRTIGNGIIFLGMTAIMIAYHVPPVVFVAGMATLLAGSVLSGFASYIQGKYGV